MNEFFLPPTDHIDNGFAATADTFQKTADFLFQSKEYAEEMGNFGTTYIPMPVQYLYRHSIELYLKSIIIRLHRSLKLPFDQDDYKKFQQAGNQFRLFYVG
ncbi:hypothetical protein CIG75_10565 [Tumebacillus algifaecis]|uniref:HEPN domain-containing protein n=1 Tax=Tumebacillus algifaecis TaxID=1214604 RepID=A0A223D0V3_9BACL|nr:hypothetical protein [Tumebacillus algifaecis]ASS75389.1 hypothetical protein CIG75_10565 [Tumebacillus algifaecis]